MPRLAALVAFSALALAACASDPKPPEFPEATAPNADPEAQPAPTAEPPPAVTAMPGQLVKRAEPDSPPEVISSYELTPSDCDALGRKYGELGRDEMLSTLSPKVSEKQRAATAAKVEESMTKRADAWIATCMSTLVNKAVDHGGIRCALASKSVKAFDVCLNGEGGSKPPPAGKGKKK